MKYILFVAILMFFAFSTAYAEVHEVGPGREFTSIGQVPWNTLAAGDIVLIHWRSQNYNEKWVVGRSGTAAAPITIRGVPGPNGELPVIDGRNATTSPNVNFYSEARSVIKIGGSNVPSSVFANFIVIENLEIRSAHPDYTFTDDSGQAQTYSSAASSIFIERGKNITVRNCRIHDSANGFFAASGDDGVSENILVEGNYIFGNGIVGSIFQHNNYTAAFNITFQYNRFGPLRSGAPGVNLKDRSAGLVVRYNWIEGGNRNIDIVNGEDSSIIRNAPEYRQTFVYGNVLVKQDGGNNQSVHYGGDTGSTDGYRKGKLYFHNNTLYSTRAGTTVAVRLSTIDETCDMRNNILFNTSAGTNMALLAETGQLTLANNWAKTGWRNSHEGGGFTGIVTGAATMVTGTAPGFVDAAAQDFRLLSTSAAVNAGTAMHPDVLPTHNVIRQYVKHQSSEARPVSGAFDLGAFEFAAAAPMTVVTTSLPNPVRFRYYDQTVQASGGSGSYVWSVSSGSLPRGLWLDPATGTIRGRARLKGTSTFTLTVQDTQNASATASQVFTVNTRLHL